jgi:glycerol-3-phosphate acyltransferase PlsX
MRIAIDAMGGDHAPREIVAGTLDAARSLPGIDELILVGREDDIRAVLPHGGLPPRVRIVPALEVVGMDESPATAVRRKKDSSISRAVDLVKTGVADAVFSAGNTGAAVAATTLKLRTLPGVLRPAIATTMPGAGATPWVLIDAGANTDCTPEMLFQFAVMGTVYAREILGIRNPGVGLMSIGGEDTKGNEITKEAFAVLKASRLAFRGNVEGHDLFTERVDVVVCDGFVGNVVLKTSESVGHYFGSLLKSELTKTLGRKLGAWIVKPGLDALRQRADPSSYGGAPLLGANGVCIIGHGASSSRAVCNAIRVSAEAVRRDISKQIEAGVHELRSA